VKREDALEKGLCTHPRCRKLLDPGSGNQWLDAKGELQRYCVAHWRELNKAVYKESGGEG